MRDDEAGRRSVSSRTRVPVEHRFAGLDRRSFAPAFVVLGLWFLWSIVVPHVNDAVAYDDEVRPGERFALTQELAVTPPSGWNVIDGFRTTDEPASGPGGAVRISNGAVSVTVLPDDFSGTARELLDQINKITTRTTDPETFHVTGGRTTVTTATGLTGASERFTSLRSDGVITAFVSDGTGIEVQAVGSTQEMAAMAAQVRQMIDSIGPWDPSRASTQDAS